MQSWLKDMNAATVRAFARANDIPVGARGNPAGSVYALFVQSQMGGQRKSGGLPAAAGLALSLGLPLLRLAADRKARHPR